MTCLVFHGINPESVKNILPKRGHMDQAILFNEKDVADRKQADLGNGLILESDIANPKHVTIYRQGIIIKKADLSDRVAKRLFVIEIIGLGALRSRLASALDVSRQTIHNYLETYKYFGIEGLIQGYSPSESKSRRKQREVHGEKRIRGNKARLLEEIRRQARKERENDQLKLEFGFGYEGKAKEIKEEDQPFAEEHDWEASRYAGAFTCLIPLITEWKWLQLITGFFGAGYKVFMVFFLMVIRNIRSIEQLKNVRVREAGIVLGIKKILPRKKFRECFYSVAGKSLSELLLTDYFRYQIKAGAVGIGLWFTDGHYLPYTGKEKIHSGYYTQRRMMSPGQTNMVTCDSSGRIADFEIQEGKGDLRSHIVMLSDKWSEDISGRPVMVFDREGYDSKFFSELVLKGIPFVTWEKNTDSEELAAIDDKCFIENIEFRDRQYGIFEGEKSFKVGNSEKEKHNFTLRRIFIWNKSSNRRLCGLARSGDLTTEECARAILARWGASENTFKHIKNRHPMHYHPGFRLVKSEKQEISNPVIKEKDSVIKRLRTNLNKLYKKFSKSKEATKKDGSPRKNSVREKVRNEIIGLEAGLEKLRAEKKELPEKVNVMSLEDYDSFNQIDNEGKNLFDFVTTSVWNARKQIIDWLRPSFSHENELVDLFYTITSCHGWVKSTSEEVIVRLEPLQQPTRRMAQEQLCRKLTNLGAFTPTGKWLKIEVGESPL